MSEMFSIMRNRGYDNKGRYEDLSRDIPFISSLNQIIKADTLEGFLFPDTYKFSKDSSESIILQTMVNTFFKRLPDDYNELSNDVGLSFYEAVILA